MSKTIGATVRYRTIDRCLRDQRHKYGIIEMIDACKKELAEVYGKAVSVSRRQLTEDIHFLESKEGYNADIRRERDGRKIYFHYADPNYSILGQPLSKSETAELRETVLMLDRFKELPDYCWMEEVLLKLEDAFRLKGNKEGVICFDQNIDRKGLEYISPLIDAILSKSVLNIRYKSFQSPKPTEHEFHPYFLKQYANRWFAFGYLPQQKRIGDLSLDRIEAISHSLMPYQDKPQDLDYNTWFKDVVGVNIPKGRVAHIVIRFAGERYPYIKNRPVHPSQRNFDKEMKISIDVKPNRELITWLLSFGSQAEVLEPQEVREMMREHVKTLNRFYK